MGQEDEVFHEEKRELWSSAGSSAKLSGQHSWPFALTLPTEIEAAVGSRGAAKERFPLPPSFSERASPAYIDYKVIVTVRRGGLRVNNVYVIHWSANSVSNTTVLDS